MGTKYISRKRNRRGNLVKYRDDRLVTAQQSTGAAQIANLKYILKNGSTGEFVEALDSIINERVRVALGTLVNNLDKGTGLAKVLGIDSSNDLGASSLANLASMLSVPRITVGYSTFSGNTDSSGLIGIPQSNLKNHGLTNSIILGVLVANNTTSSDYCVAAIPYRYSSAFSGGWGVMVMKEDGTFLKNTFVTLRIVFCEW